jgi:hypothetical protein
MPRLRSALVAPAALLLALAPAALAHAEGSVPSEVRTYVTDGSLVRQLNDVYGPDADGDGIDFADTTTTGTIERVHVWSEALRAGEDTDHPVDLLNEWIVPISIAEAPVGVATVWINPDTVAPELASFVADADLATALSAVPDGSSLVRDAESAAWLALADDGTLTPLVPGSTGLSTPVPLDDVAILPAAAPGPAATGDPGTGVGLAIAVVLLLLAVIVVALIVPTVRKKKVGPAAEEAVSPALAGDPPVAEESAEGANESQEPTAPPKPKKPKKPSTKDVAATADPTAPDAD